MKISDYPIYDEAKFLLEREKYTLDELTEEIAGYSQIAANEDELGDVKRSLKILAELGFLELGEDGDISLHDDLSTGACHRIVLMLNNGYGGNSSESVEAVLTTPCLLRVESEWPTSKDQAS